MPNTAQRVSFIEEHLHSQYAQNIYNNTTSIISIAIALLSVVGAFGYVFVMSEDSFRDYYFCVGKEVATYNLTTLFAVATALTVVLGIIFWISLTTGSTLRKEQFIVHAMRKNHDTLFINECPCRGILPEDYHPFDKNDAFVPGLFGEILKICPILYCVVVFLLGLRSLCVLILGSSVTTLGVAWVCIFIVCSVAVIDICWCGFNHKKVDYDKLCDSFKNYRPTTGSKNQAKSSFGNVKFVISVAIGLFLCQILLLAICRILPVHGVQRHDCCCCRSHAK